ncbi:hypothetical protein R1sor_019934 [Riccia sorocarpa]|uniref:PP2A regulatory subunit TAP46 n=1 Tax=Riccia sorocarpa TaxID=122646 RepID=A0ABD3IE27_9MARC
MGEEFGEDVPLPALFERAADLYNLSQTTILSEEQVKGAIKLLESCQEKIEQLGLFSANEEKEDISTADLKYLLVPYYVAELCEKLPSSDRLQVVRTSLSHLRAFIRRCDNYNLVPGGEIEALTRDTPASAEVRRIEKVARFKRQRAAEAKLQELKERKERWRRSTQAAGKTSTLEHGEENLPDEDDEEEREAQFAQLSLVLCKAFDQVDMLKKEEDMLIAVQELRSKEGNDAVARGVLEERQARAEVWHKQAAAASKTVIRDPTLAAAVYGKDVIEGRAPVIGNIYHDPRPQQSKPLLFGPASVLQGGLSTERERMVAEVFQPSHRLPTMSIEQAGLAEMEMMRKWNEQNARLRDEANSSWHTEKRQPGEEEGSDDESAAYKARAWDDWKDENPRGAGNTSSKPVR